MLLAAIYTTRRMECGGVPGSRAMTLSGKVINGSGETGASPPPTPAVRPSPSSDAGTVLLGATGRAGEKRRERESERETAAGGGAGRRDGVRGERKTEAELQLLWMLR